MSSEQHNKIIAIQISGLKLWTHTHALCSLWNVKSFQVSDQSTYKLNDYKYKIHEVFVQAIINFKLFTDIVPQHSTVFRLCI